MATIRLLDYSGPAKDLPAGPEPRVVTEDVSAVLKRIITPHLEDAGQSVALIAERAETSTRTVYRVLSATTKTLRLDLADRLCLAAGAHISECRLEFPPDSAIT